MERIHDPLSLASLYGLWGRVVEDVLTPELLGLVAEDGVSNLLEAISAGFRAPQKVVERPYM